MRLDAISSFAVERYKKERLDKKAANSTINRELATLSHIQSKAVEWRWIDRLPARPKKFKEAGGRIIALTDEQCDALMRAAIGSADSDCWLFVAFGLNTAMRHSEILRARFDQVDFDKLRLFIPEAKAGEREQPITPELADMLSKEREMRRDRKGWIFPALRQHAATGHRIRMRRPFQDAVERAGLDPNAITPHVMRHTAITNLVQAGIDLATIQRISGHKTVAMVMRYTHVHGQHIDRAIRAIGRGLPEPSVNKTAGTTTQGLHTTPKVALRSISGTAKKTIS
jgi:integrase